MRVDIDSLGTFNQLAHEGAEAATAALAQLTGIDATVDVTRITLVEREEIGEDLAGREFAGVQFGFSGALEGRTVLVFDADSVETIGRALMADMDPSMAESGVKEIGNIMMSGFIDGWADYLEATIDHTPPEYIEGPGATVVPDAPAEAAYDQAFVFKSEIEWVGESVNFYIYMLPAYDPLAGLMADHAADPDDAVPIDKLEVFNRMTTKGTETAAANVEAMTGIPTEAEVSRISFAPIEDVPKQIGEETYVGTVVEFTGVPSGYLMVLFDEASAITVAEALLPGDGPAADSTGAEGGDAADAEGGDAADAEGDDAADADGDDAADARGDGAPAATAGGLTERHESAVEELGNIMTSGFVDGWANVLRTSVDHTPPRLVHDMGRAIVDPLAAQVGQHQEHAFIIDSEMRTDDVEFRAEIHALPNERELRRALEDLEVDRADETEADVEKIFEQ